MRAAKKVVNQGRNQKVTPVLTFDIEDESGEPSAINTVLAFPKWSEAVSVEIDVSNRPTPGKCPVSTLQQFLKFSFG